MCSVVATQQTILIKILFDQAFEEIKYLCSKARQQLRKNTPFFCLIYGITCKIAACLNESKVFL